MHRATNWNRSLVNTVGPPTWYHGGELTLEPYSTSFPHWNPSNTSAAWVTCRLTPTGGTLAYLSTKLVTHLAPSELINVHTGACSEAGGAFCNGNWFYVYWPTDVPCISPHHINAKELTTVIMAVQVWCHTWANHHVVIHFDNKMTEAVINNGTGRNSTCLDLLKHLASLAWQFYCTISASYITGVENTTADTISRLHEPS